MPKKISLKINGKTLSRATINDLLSLSDRDWSRLDKEQGIRIENKFRKEAERRLSIMQKHGMRSFAFERYFGDELPSLSTRASSIQSVQHHLAMYRTFFESKSSSYKGAREIYKQEENRIFNRETGSRRKEFRSEEERKRFWTAYQEFLNQNPVYQYESTRVQQFLGSESFWRKRDFNADDLSSLLKKLMNSEGGFEFNVDI